jgi:hypothetical protein
MAGTKIVALGFDYDDGTYRPISVTGGGYINVHITDSVSLTVAGTGANNADNVAAVATGLLPTVSYGYLYDGATFDRQRGFATNSDAIAALTQAQSQAVAAFNFGWNGNTFDRARVANVFKTVQVSAAGDTTLWTPAAGKKFRLMGLAYTNTMANGGAGVVAVTALVKDNADAFLTFTFGTPVGIATNLPGNTILLGNGKLSSAANNSLVINLSAAAAAGILAVNVWGTEE